MIASITFANHEKSIHWAREKNNGLDPEDFAMKSNKKIWMLCPNPKCNHFFQTSPKIICEGRWCPYCAFPCKKLCSDYSCIPCYKKSFASHKNSRLWSPKNDQTPRDIFKKARGRFWFTCFDCGHDFTGLLGKMAEKGRCTYCVKNLLCSDETCEICKSRSFSSHPKSKWWITEKNIKEPREVSKHSSTKYWFYCKKCGHDFIMRINSIVETNSWCHYCSRTKLCGKPSCTVCYKKSLACHKKSAFWSSENVLSPLQVFAQSSKKFKFDCLCGHQIEMTPLSISRGQWCIYCCKNSITLCPDKECVDCTERSFASHPKALYWSKNNEKTPRDMIMGSMKKFWFNCDKNPDHEFMMKLCAVKSGQWCPKCKHKMEAKLFDLLAKYYSVIHQARFEWCRSQKGKTLPFDFHIKNTKILIELDGGQHFKQIFNWQSPEYTQSQDKLKMNKAYENNFCVIRITWDIVYEDKWDWFSHLRQIITQMIDVNEGGLGAYICDKGEYKVY